LNPNGIWWDLGTLGDGQVTTPRLRRRSADVVAVFMLGWSMQQIADALGVHVDLINDSIRWEMNRRERRRQ
jgi:hypothetical protein